MGFRWMCLDQGELTFDYGNGVYSCLASAGRAGMEAPSKEFAGPIPPGEYILDPHADHYSHVEGIRYLLRRFIGDGGHYRVKLKAYQVPNRYNRDEFFLWRVVSWAG